MKVEQAAGDAAEDAAAAARKLEARLETAGQPAAVFVEGGLAPDDEGAAVAEASPAQPSRKPRRGRSKPSGAAAAPAAKPARQRKGRQPAKDSVKSADAEAAMDAPVRPGTRGIGAVATAKVRKPYCWRPPRCNAPLAEPERHLPTWKALLCSLLCLACTVGYVCGCDSSNMWASQQVRTLWSLVPTLCGGALNLQEAALEKKRAGENRAVEHVALDDDPSDGVAAKPAKRARRKQQA